MDGFNLIKRADIPLTLFGSTEVGHADIVEMDNHIKVNMRIRKDQGVLAQLMEQGLVGLTIEYDGIEALHRAREQEARRESGPLTLGKLVNEEIKKGLADCE